jgi:hypothetical protein
MSTDHADQWHWLKSSYSGSGGGDCLEVVSASGIVHVRDSKTASHGPVLHLRRESWTAFLVLTGVE